MIEVSGLTFAYPHAAAPGAATTSRCRYRRARPCWSSGRPAAASRPSSAASTGSCRTSTAGASPGRVSVGGLDTLRHQPRDLARVVGMVFQDPESQFVADVVEDELAFGMENMGVSRLTMRKRVEEVLDVLGIAHLRRRRLDTLSGGELQRVAIGAVLTMQPKMLVLDEPTSQLDPQAAEEVLTTVQRLNSDLGLTVVIAEHRLERVVQHVDRVLYLPGDGSVASYPVREAMAALAAGAAGGPHRSRARLGAAAAVGARGEALRDETAAAAGLSSTDARRRRTGRRVQVEGLCLSYGDGDVLKDVSLARVRGEVLALMGRNGAGKTSLLRSLIGLADAAKGVGARARRRRAREQHRGAEPAGGVRAAGPGVGPLPRQRRSGDSGHAPGHRTARARVDEALRNGSSSRCGARTRAT